MYEASVLIAVVLMIFAAFDYVRRAWVRETNPVPATWILMAVVFSLSLWMYWHSPRRSWTANIGVTAGFFNTAIILLGVIAANKHYGTLHIMFDRVQQWCLAGGAIVFGFWYFTNQPLTSYILVQAIALIAYGATIKRLWSSKRSTEPLFLWIAALFANLCALYPAWVKNDPFSWIYLGRALPSTILVVYLIIRIKMKMRLAST